MVGADHRRPLWDVLPPHGAYRMEQIEKGPDDEIEESVELFCTHSSQPPFHQGDQGLQALLQSQLRGIQQHSVLRLTERGHRPVPVLFIPLDDVPENGLQLRLLSPLLQFQQAAAGPGLRRGGKEDLCPRVREHHRPDVPAVHDHVVLHGLTALKVQQEVPHRGQGSHLGGQSGDLVDPDSLCHVTSRQVHPLYTICPIIHAQVQPLQQRGDLLRVGWIRPCLPGPQGHRAVDGPRVYIQIPQLPGQRPGPGCSFRPRRGRRWQRFFPAFLISLQNLIDSPLRSDGTQAPAPPRSCPRQVRAALSPAARPVAQAIWRLKPPV